MFFNLRATIINQLNDVLVESAVRWRDPSTGKYYVEVKFFGWVNQSELKTTHVMITDSQNNEIGYQTIIFAGRKKPKILFWGSTVFTTKLKHPTPNMLEAQKKFRSDESTRYKCSICGSEGVIQVSATTVEFGDASFGYLNHACADPNHQKQVREKTKGITVTERFVHKEPW